jgi:hypothetical protein
MTNLRWILIIPITSQSENNPNKLIKENAKKQNHKY